MPPGLLLALVLIPSMLFGYVVLTTFYGSTRAYIAIAWLPIAFAVGIWIFRLLLRFQHVSDEWWRDFAITVGWASLAQAALGVLLMIHSLYQRQRILGLLLATSVAASPFLLLFFR